MLQHILLAVLALAIPSGAQQDTQDPAPEPARPSHADWGAYALGGLDPIELCEGKDVAGDDRWFARWGRFHYRFASEAHRDRFVMDPERWCIQWDGACARMGPMSGVGSPDRWLVHGGRIYIFASDGCRNGFAAAPERYLPTPMPGTNPLPEHVEAGEAWLRRAVEAHGGEAPLRALQGVSLQSHRDQQGWRAGYAVTVMQNGNMRYSADWLHPDDDDILTAWTLTSKDAFTTENEDVWPIHSAHGRRQVRRHAHRQPVTHLWAFLHGTVIAVHEGQGQLQDAPTELVRVTHDGVTTVLHLDPGTGRILGMHWTGWVDDGVIQTLVESFTEWQDVDGVQIAKARTHSVDGKFFDPGRKCFREIRALKSAPASLVRPQPVAPTPSKDD